MSNFLRTQKDKDFILSNVREPYSIENYLSEDDIGELIDVWESSDNKEYKNTGPITSKIENFDNPALSKIRDLIYFGDEVEDRKVHPNIDIWYAMFFYVDAPHIIHMDDRIDTLTQIYKAFNFPLKFEGGSEEPHLMFFVLLYLDGPSKFFNGENNKTKGYHESLQFAELPRSMCVYEYSNVIHKTTNLFDKEINKHYLNHISDDWLKGLSYNSAHKWKPGNAIVFDSCRLHCGSDFREIGIKSKLGISIFTQHSDAYK